MKRIAVVAAAFAGCCLMLGCKGNNAPARVAEYAVLEITTADRVVTDTYPASVEGRQDVAVYPQVSGTITQVCFKEGDRVRKGQTLFIIDQVPYKSALQMAEANVEAAKAQVETSQILYDSKQALYDEQVISEFDLSTSRAQLATAKAQLAQAEASAVSARHNLEYTVVKSPVEGVAGTIPYRAGALVSPSLPQPLTTVSDNSEMYVYCSVTENQLLDMIGAHGSMAEVIASLPAVDLRLNNGAIYSCKGRIETISGVINPTTGCASMRVVFPNEGGLLHSGASANVIIPDVRKDCIVIPQDATFEVQDKVLVYKIVDGVTRSSQVKVVPTDDGKEYIVEEGLAPGDVIIAEGAGLLRDGVSVTAKQQ